MQGNNSDDVRRHNLGTILRQVHRNGATSRAQLTRLTGLNRSTVAALVSELSQLGFVTERDPDPTNQVGRPSPLVVASDRVVAVAVNPEVDAVTVGVVGLDGVVHRRIRRPFPASPSVGDAVEAVVDIVDEMRAELEAEFRVVGIGVAVPGLVRASDGLVRHAPHLG